MAIISYLEKQVLAPDPDENREIYRGDYRLLNHACSNTGVISSAQSDKPILATWGLGPCIALSGYDSNSKTGFLTHNSALTDIKGLNDKVLRTLREMLHGNLTLSYYIIGGWKGGDNDEWNSTKLLARIKDYLHITEPDCQVLEEDVLDPLDTRLGKSFLLDTRNGKVYSIKGGGQIQHVPPAERIRLN